MSPGCYLPIQLIDPIGYYIDISLASFLTTLCVHSCTFFFVRCFLLATDWYANCLNYFDLLLEKFSGI